MITNYSTLFERLDFKRHDCAEQFFPLDSIVNDDDKDDNDDNGDENNFKNHTQIRHLEA